MPKECFNQNSRPGGVLHSLGFFAQPLKYAVQRILALQN